MNKYLHLYVYVSHCIYQCNVCIYVYMYGMYDVCTYVCMYLSISIYIYLSMQFTLLHIHIKCWKDMELTKTSFAKCVAKDINYLSSIK